MTKAVVVSEVVNEAWRQVKSYWGNKAGKWNFNEFSSEDGCSESHLTAWVYLFSCSVIKSVTGLHLIQYNSFEDGNLLVLDVLFCLQESTSLMFSIRVILKASIKRYLSISYTDFTLYENNLIRVQAFCPWAKKAQIHFWHNIFEVGGICSHTEHIKPLGIRKSRDTMKLLWVHRFNSHKPLTTLLNVKVVIPLEYWEYFRGVLFHSVASGTYWCKYSSNDLFVCQCWSMSV